MNKFKKDPFICPKFWLSDFVRVNGGIKYRLIYRPNYHYEDGATHKIKGRVIITCNHNTSIEPPTLFTLFLKRRLFFIIAKELIKSKRTAWFYKRLNCIPIDRQGNNFSQFKEVFNWLKKGRAIVIFPEGALSEDGSNKDFKDGAAMLSLYSNTPILPLYIQNKQNKKEKINVCIGKYFYPTDICDGKKTKENMQLITKYIQDKTFEMKERLNSNKDWKKD